MSLPCRLSIHTAAPLAFRNQGFEFSKCRRCSRDMIRSAESSEAKWRTVPAGFRVDWKNTDTNQLLNSHRASAVQTNTMIPPLLGDFMHVTTALLYWRVRDYLSRPTQRREVILRISHTQDNFSG